MIYCANTKSTDRVSIQAFLPLEDDEVVTGPTTAEKERMKAAFLKTMQSKPQIVKKNAKPR